MNLKKVILSDASTEAKVSAIAILLDKELPKLTEQVQTVKKLEGKQGERGLKGDKGDKGKDGKDGKDGRDGKDGPTGKDGKDGDDGISVVNAKVDFDDTLVISLSNGKEINVGEVKGEKGDSGRDGNTGLNGVGVPTGGTTGQVLAKNSNADYDTEWVNGGGGGGAITSVASADGTVIVSTMSGDVDLSVPATTNVVCLVRNATGATLTKGTVVYINGAIGQHPTVTKAIATGDATSAQTLGVMKDDLANNSNGFVTIIGLVIDVDTSAFTDGQQLYLSPTTAGALTATKPYAPNHLVYIAVVEYAHPVHGELFVKVQNGYEMDELHNVSAQNATNGQVLIYNESTDLWEKNTLTDGTGITISEGAGSITITNSGVNSAVAGTGISVSGATGDVTITNSAPDQTVALTGGTGITTSGTYPNFTITNSSPDQTVALTGAGTTAITGTYPNFTVTSNDAYTGTVTSVGGTGTVSGLTLSGTVTSSGNLTLGGAITGFATSGANTNLTSVALTTGTISTAPSSSSDIVNKAYADSIAGGVNFHTAAQYATTAALAANTYNNGTSGVGATLTGNSVGALSIDGVTPVVGQRILVKNESTQANNGIYTVTVVGNGSTAYQLTRAVDFDSSGAGVDQIDAGDFIYVIAGSTLANTSWVQQTPLPITVGTTAIVFVQFAAGGSSYTAGTGLTLTANQFSITNTGTAGTYGSASAVPVLTTNAQGQVTSVTNTSIAISGGAVSGDIAGNAANVTGTVAFANGGTGETTRQAAMDALAGATTSGSYLRGNGTDVVMSTIQVADVPTLNQNTTGSSGSVANALTAGTNITFSSGTTYNGSAAITINATGGGGFTPTIDRLTSTQQSTSTALADVTQLVRALVANATYSIDCFVTFQSAATTTGLNLGFTSPTGCVCSVEVVVPITSTAAATQLRTTFPNAAATNTGNVLGTGVTAINSNHTARISGIITNGANAGNFQVRFATEVNASAVTLQTSSVMILERLV